MVDAAHRSVCLPDPKTTADAVVTSLDRTGATDGTDATSTSSGIRKFGLAISSTITPWQQTFLSAMPRRDGLLETWRLPIPLQESLA